MVVFLYLANLQGKLAVRACQGCHFNKLTLTVNIQALAQGARLRLSNPQHQVRESYTATHTMISQAMHIQSEGGLSEAAVVLYSRYQGLYYIGPHLATSIYLPV